MKYLSAVLVIVLFAFVNNTAFAQIPEKAMEIPVKYVTPQEEVSLVESENTRPGSFWVVFSDKNDNKTYENSSGKKHKNTIGFMNDFYVAEETRDRLHIVKDVKYREGFSSSAEDYGWVDKEDMLLWDHCLVTRSGDINKKAMVLNTVESLMKDKIKEKDQERVNYYFDKELSQESDRSSKIYEILYIYKITDDAILLGKNYVTEISNIENEMFGWVSNKKITIWDHRIAIEPNWNEDAAQERKIKKTPSTFYVDVARAKKAAEGKRLSDKYVIWNNDSYNVRNIGDWRRFPLLEFNKQTGIIKAGVMGELRSIMDRKDTISQTGFADIQRNYNELRSKQRNINIVFVVDGTTSMGPYLPVISNAIISSMNQLIKSYTVNSLRFSAVIYRDQAEGQMLTQVKKLSDNYKDVANWLHGIKAIDKYDKDQPEAVYYGIKTAIRAVGLPQNETNVVILIGDAGNHHRDDPSQVNSQEIIDLLYRYDCNFLAFQVHNETNPTYDEFGAQMKGIILSTSEKKYQQNKKITAQSGRTFPSPRFIHIAENVWVLDTTSMIGTVVLAKKGVPKSPNQLQKEIDRTVKFSSELTNRKLRILEGIISEGKSFEGAIADEQESENDDYYQDDQSEMLSGSSYSPAIIDFLRKMGIPESKLKIIMAENYQLYFPAYAPMKIHGQQNPLFNQVLFVTLKELGILLNKFDRLADAYTASAQRQKLKDVWMELLQTHLGEDFNREKAENMTFEKINEKVFGLPGTSALLHKTLGQITDPSNVSDGEFYEYVQHIKLKRGELNKIYNNRNYDFGFHSYDTQYFWISQDMLP